VSVDDRSSSARNRLLEVLPARGALPAMAPQLALFGQFVGSWDIAGRLFDERGSVRQHSSEWHFGWVLEGRAIQDVLVRPRRSVCDAPADRDEYGTTLRIYDHDAERWLVTWIAPVSGTVVQLIGRPHGEEIWIEGNGPEGLPYRWILSDITENAFVWRGHHFNSAEGDWFLGHEMVACRMSRS
jgi:hypothetical protein